MGSGLLRYTVISLDFYSTKHRNSHWLILGQVVLNKIKCTILIVINLSNYTLLVDQHVIKAWKKVALQKARKLEKHTLLNLVSNYFRRVLSILPLGLTKGKWNASGTKTAIELIARRSQ